MGLIDRLFPALNAQGEARAIAARIEQRSFTAPTRSTNAVARPVAGIEALSLGSVYRAVNLITTAVKQLPWDIVAEGVKQPSTTFTRQPDPSLTRAAFLEQTTSSLAMNGNAFWRVGRNARGEGVTAEVLNPELVVIEQDVEGRVTGYTYRGNLSYGLRDIKHLALFRVAGRARGLSPIEAANAELRGHVDLSNYSANWFAEGGVPNGYLTTPSYITPEDAADAKADWNTSASAANGVAVLGNDLKFQATGLTPSEALAADLRKLSATEVARLFGVPASLMLADAGDSLTYANVQQEWLAWVRFGITQYSLEIETAFSDLLPRGKSVKFNYDALLRADTLTRYQAHSIALAGQPFATVQEIRDLEDMGAM